MYSAKCLVRCCMAPCCDCCMVCPCAGTDEKDSPTLLGPWCENDVEE